MMRHLLMLKDLFDLGSWVCKRSVLSESLGFLSEPSHRLFPRPNITKNPQKHYYFVDFSII